MRSSVSAVLSAVGWVVQEQIRFAGLQFHHVGQPKPFRLWHRKKSGLPGLENFYITNLVRNGATHGTFSMAITG
jgi:hypothetical protein